MNGIPTITDATFRAGDNVVLAEGPYQGTSGVFLRLTKDVKWAEIEERDKQGAIRGARSHPVIWLKHAA